MNSRSQKRFPSIAPGMGKTTASLAIAAAISTGISLPGSVGYDAPAPVIVQNAEDSYSQTIRPRLEQSGADCDMIYNIDDDEEALSFTDDRIEQIIIQTGARLYVLDPVQSFFNGANMNSTNTVRPIMKHLATIAARHDCAILLVGHLNKSGGKSTYRGLGSIDIYAAARSVLTVGGTGIDENTRVMVHNKSNLAPAGKPQSFTLDPVLGFNWAGEYDISVDEVVNGRTKSEKQLAKAKQLILTTLSGGAVLAVTIISAAGTQGISHKTLYRAKAALGVISFKRGDQWYWEIPSEVVYTEFTENNQHGQDSQDGHTAMLPTLTMLNGTEVI